MGKKIASVRHNPYLMGKEVDFRHTPERGNAKASFETVEYLIQKGVAIRGEKKSFRQSFKNRGCKAPAIPEVNFDGKKAGRDDAR